MHTITEQQYAKLRRRVAKIDRCASAYRRLAEFQGRDASVDPTETPAGHIAATLTRLQGRLTLYLSRCTYPSDPLVWTAP